MNTSFALACTLFYFLPLAGATIRVRRNKNRHTLMQFGELPCLCFLRR